MNTKSRKKIPIKTYLITLVILTFLATGITLSRYLTTVEGLDQARVAGVVVITDLSKDSTTIPLELNNIKPGDTHSYDFSVTNNDGSQTSEVSFKFNIEITSTQNIPFTITLKETFGDETVFTYDEIEERIISNDYNIGAGSIQTVDFILDVDWDSLDNDPIYQQLTDTLTIKVSWEQIT